MAPPSASVAIPPPDATPKAVLELAEVKIEEMDGKHVLTLTSDGKALDAKGEEITRIDASGKLGRQDRARADHSLRPEGSPRDHVRVRQPQRLHTHEIQRRPPDGEGSKFASTVTNGCTCEDTNAGKRSADSPSTWKK